MADLRKPMREHADEAMFQQAIRDAILRKPKGHDFDYSRQKVDGQVIRQMSHIGGEAQGRCCTDRRVRHAVTKHFFGGSMTIRQDIIDKLGLALPIEHLEVINESHKHNVPEGAESHFNVVIVSSAFEGKKLLARHRLLNGILAKILSTHIHALALHTMTKEEWSISQETPASPPCMGGGARR